MLLTLTIVHVIVSILLIITVLLQFGRGAEAGFFSSTDSQGVFAGPSQSNLLSKSTTFLAIVFLGLALVLANLRGQQRDSSVFDSEEVIAQPLGTQPLGTPDAINTPDNAPADTAPAAATPENTEAPAQQ